MGKHKILQKYYDEKVPITLASATDDSPVDFSKTAIDKKFQCDSVIVTDGESMEVISPEESRDSCEIDVEEPNDKNETKHLEVKGKRNPKCAKCLFHGKNVAVKGHKRKCPFKMCPCAGCNLTIQRRVISAQQIALRRRIEEDPTDTSWVNQLPEVKRPKMHNGCDNDGESGYATEDKSDRPFTVKNIKEEMKRLDDILDDAMTAKDQETIIKLLQSLFLRPNLAILAKHSREYDNKARKVIDTIIRQRFCFKMAPPMPYPSTTTLSTISALMSPPLSSGSSVGGSPLSTSMRHLRQFPFPPMLPQMDHQLIHAQSLLPNHFLPMITSSMNHSNHFIPNVS